MHFFGLFDLKIFQMSSLAQLPRTCMSLCFSPIESLALVGYHQNISVKLRTRGKRYTRKVSSNLEKRMVFKLIE